MIQTIKKANRQTSKKIILLVKTFFFLTLSFPSFAQADSEFNKIENSQKLIQEEKYVEAISILENMSSQTILKEEISYLLAKAYFNLDQYQKAYDALKSYPVINTDYGSFEYKSWFSQVEKVLALKIKIQEKLKINNSKNKSFLKVFLDLDEEISIFNFDQDLFKKRFQLLYQERRWIQIKKLFEDKNLDQVLNRFKYSQDQKCFIKFQYGKAIYYSGEKDKSLAIFKNLSKNCKGSNQVNSLYWQGLVLRGKNYLTKSIPIYEELYSHPQAGYLKDDALYYLIQIAEDTRRPELKKKFEKKMKDLPKGDLKEKYLWDLAFKDYLNKKYQSSLDKITDLKKGSHQNPEFYPKLLYWEAKIYEKLKQDERSKEIRNKIVDQYPLSYYSLLVHSIDYSGFKFPKIPKFEKPILKSSANLKVKVPNLELYFEKLLQENREENISNWIYYLNYYYPDIIKENRLFFSWWLHQSHQYYLGIIFFSEAESLGTHDYLSKSDLKYFPLYYPLAFTEEINSVSQSLDISPYQILGISREESLFRSEVFSSVGARGLMQLMPPTATEQAKIMKISNFKIDQLAHPLTNLKIGSAYFKRLNQSRSIPLAIMSYNAGPSWVRRWLKSDGHLSTDEFIEKIPFGETRKYTKRVLRTMAAYQYLKLENNKTSWNPIISPNEIISKKYYSN